MLWGGLNNIASRYRMSREDIALIGLTQEFIKGISEETMAQSGVTAEEMNEYMKKAIEEAKRENETVKIISKGKNGNRRVE